MFTGKRRHLRQLRMKTECSKTDPPIAPKKEKIPAEFLKLLSPAQKIRLLALLRTYLQLLIQSLSLAGLNVTENIKKPARVGKAKGSNQSVSGSTEGADNGVSNNGAVEGAENGVIESHSLPKKKKKRLSDGSKKENKKNKQCTTNLVKCSQQHVSKSSPTTSLKPLIPKRPMHGSSSPTPAKYGKEKNARKLVMMRMKG